MIRLVTFAAMCLFLPMPAFAELTRHRFEQDGIARQFFVYTPDRAGRHEPMPVVLMLHGGGGSARQMLRSPGRRMNDLAETEGFIAVYPDAVGRSWDFGEGKVSEGRRAPRVDDLAYFRRVIDHITASPRADGNRVYATGISRGGQASFFLACKLPDRIHAIAPVAMSLPAFLADDCRSIPATPIALIHGTDDPLVPYEGGQIRLFRKNRGEVLGAERTMALLSQRNGCRAQANTRRMGEVQRIEWNGCQASTVLYRVEGGGHTWPGEREVLPRRLVGKTNRDIDATAEIWRFFSRL
ncbi:hypothetical protein DEA8626_02774 [Defluviimonas aquaemixtae]|uniref:Polyhydroxybutyrate depolymerase n=1 Tax=Albidovulum aquaemixtae TaxID=1542388 RepID=A0A2R8BK37_9RHOB|nr:PHB depolymerase family esterase [Defluviimonas aquaemixtae]SPH23708.1 hypothetical protein DEA8626_02774 [Defluviimonas aquaemixtae]